MWTNTKNIFKNRQDQVFGENPDASLAVVGNVSENEEPEELEEQIFEEENTLASGMFW